MKTLLVRHLAAFAWLCLVVNAASTSGVTLAWDPNPETDLAGYKINAGTTSGKCTNVLDVKNVLQVSVLDLSRGSTNFFTAKAYNLGGLESDPSAEISTVINVRYVIDVFNPGPTTTVLPSGYTFSTSAVVSVKWPTNTLSSVIGYRLAYGLSASNMPMVVDTGTDTRLRILGVVSNTTYHFSVQALDADGAKVSMPPISWQTRPDVTYTNLVFTNTWENLPPWPVKRLRSE